MTVTASQVLADVRARLDEATATFWNDSELYSWINEATRDIARRAEVLQKTADIDVSAGTNEYTLDEDVARIYRAIWVADGSSQQYPLEYQDFNSMDSAGWTWTNAQGWPSVFTLWGYNPSLKIVLYPKPSAAGTVTIYYYGYPVAVTTGSDTVDIPSGWEDLISLYCEAVALRKDANPRWQEAKQLYEAALGEMIDRSRRWSDQSNSIQANGMWLPGWLWNPDY